MTSIYIINTIASYFFHLYPIDLHPPTHNAHTHSPAHSHPHRHTKAPIQQPLQSCPSSAALASDEGPNPENCTSEKSHFLAARFLQLPTGHSLQIHQHPLSARIRPVWQPAPALLPALMDSLFTQLSSLPRGCTTGHLSCLIGNTLSQRPHFMTAKTPRAATLKPLRETLMVRMRTRHSSPWSYPMQAL